MKIISPIAITDGMVGSGAGTVVEVEHPEWAGGTTYNALQKVIVKGTQGTFQDLVTGNKSWAGMAAAPNGDVYGCVDAGEIWKQTGGIGSFVSLSVGSKFWRGMAAAPNGDIYACAYQGSIWKQTGGIGSFVDLVTGDKDWEGMAAAPNGDVYGCVYGGSIWKQTGGVGSFVDLVTGNKNWNGMATAPNGDVYGCVYGGSIWKQTGGVGSFVDLVTGNKNWSGMATAPNGDVYGCVYGGSIWKQTGGVGSFVDLVTGNKDWNGMAAAPNGDVYGIYACVYAGSIWISTLEVVHKIYESLTATNISRYPPIDVRQTTPQWLEISATNKWKVFDGKVNNQMQVISPAVYVITPGIAFNSVALLNVEATSVTIAVDSPAYSQTVSTGATDIVKMDLAGGVASILTITITNTAGLAKCGEIVIGNFYTMGTFQRKPTVGIVDYSTATQDVFGDWNIIPRGYSKKMTCAFSVVPTSVDAVYKKLSDYRQIKLVWVGSSTYACTILYGKYNDFSIPLDIPGVPICTIEILSFI